jgi:hypothetical protein
MIPVSEGDCDKEALKAFIDFANTLRRLNLATTRTKDWGFSDMSKMSIRIKALYYKSLSR